MGLPPALQCTEAAAYWGQKVETNCGEMQKMLGQLDPGPQQPDQRQHWHAAQANGLNIRQYMDQAKQAQQEMHMPPKPSRVEQEPPENINVYSDGAVKIPSCQQLAIGGFGIWWPNQGQHEEHQQQQQQPQQQPQQEEQQTQLMYSETWNGGKAEWAPMKSMWQSSTRAELAALVIATSRNLAIHIGIDNAAVVNKARILIELARGFEEKQTRYPAKPLRKPFIRASTRWRSLETLLGDTGSQRSL